MTIRYATHADMQQLFAGHATVTEDGTEYYEGFDLMTPFSLNPLLLEEGSPEYGCQFLVYVNNQEQPIALIKYKRYSLPDHNFAREDEPDEHSYLAIRALDVHRDYRRQGIAKQLAKALYERHPEAYVVGGRATPSGERANIHSWMKNQFSPNYYISEVDLVDKWEDDNAW